MISAFKSTKIAGYLVMIVCVFAYIRTIVVSPSLPVLMGITLFMVLIIEIIRLYAKLKYKKLWLIINNQCHVKEFTIKMQEVYDYNKKNRIREIFALDLSAGYLHLGDSKSAKQTLDSISPNPEKRSGAIKLIAYYNNLAVYYMQVKDFDHAKECLDMLSDILFKGKLSEKDKMFYSHYYTTQKHVFHVNTGKYDGERNFFERQLWKDKTIIGRVHLQYLLGIIYLQEQEDKKAKDAFEYTIAHGGDSYYVLLTKKLIEHE